MRKKNTIPTFLILFLSNFYLCTAQKVQLTQGLDESAGGRPVYIITTPSAIYHLDKEGGGLSSMKDKDGIDWIGFHNREGSRHKGEFRGFPNAIHRQDGSYFHPMNAKTDSSSSVVDKESKENVRIIFTSKNKKWQGQWDFYANRCDFTMTKISPGYHYWVQYEGVPGGEMERTDFWYVSGDKQKHQISESQSGDLPAPEWMAFGDVNSPRVLYLLHHEDDSIPDEYVYRTDMTVFGFGRQNGLKRTRKFLNTVQTFSIGFVESTDYFAIDQSIQRILTK